MFTNFTNYKIVNNTKGAKTFAKVGGIKPTKTSLVTAVSRHAEKPAERQHSTQIIITLQFIHNT